MKFQNKLLSVIYKFDNFLEEHNLPALLRKNQLSSDDLWSLFNSPKVVAASTPMAIKNLSVIASIYYYEHWLRDFENIHSTKLPLEMLVRTKAEMMTCRIPNELLSAKYLYENALQAYDSLIELNRLTDSDVYFLANICMHIDKLDQAASFIEQHSANGTMNPINDLMYLLIIRLFRDPSAMIAKVLVDYCIEEIQKSTTVYVGFDFQFALTLLQIGHKELAFRIANELINCNSCPCSGLYKLRMKTHNNDISYLIYSESEHNGLFL